MAVAFKSRIYYATPVDLMYFVYILQNEKRDRLCIGFTQNIDKRFMEHNKGESLATKPFRPYNLIHYEAFIEKRDAKSRERFLKSGWGRKSIKKMLRHYL